MKTKRIHDRIDLRHILAALGQRASTSWWKVSGVPSVDEALMVHGRRSEELEEFDRSGRRVRGDGLLLVASGVDQVIWGRFEGFDAQGSDEPWIVVIAFDSTWFDVSTADDAALARIGAAFADVELLPGDQS
ncbi:MAG: hypothetical protein J0H01_17085 [Rhizobiales bacterium]|nr:hypothetical protein [Hyphomicrobiales bacterium]